MRCKWHISDWGRADPENTSQLYCVSQTPMSTICLLIPLPQFTFITSWGRRVLKRTKGNKKDLRLVCKECNMTALAKLAAALEPYSRVTKGNFLSGKYSQRADKEYYASSFTVGEGKETWAVYIHDLWVADGLVGRSLEGKELEDQRQGGLVKSYIDLWAHRWAQNMQIFVSPHAQPRSFTIKAALTNRVELSCEISQPISPANKCWCNDRSPWLVSCSEPQFSNCQVRTLPGWKYCHLESLACYSSPSLKAAFF